METNTLESTLMELLSVEKATILLQEFSSKTSKYIFRCTKNKDRNIKKPFKKIGI
jgi:hypothetical protein